MLRFIPVKKITTSKNVIFAVIVFIAICIFLLAFMRASIRQEITIHATMKRPKTEHNGNIFYYNETLKKSGADPGFWNMGVQKSIAQFSAQIAISLTAGVQGPLKGTG